MQEHKKRGKPLVLVSRETIGDETAKDVLGPAYGDLFKERQVFLQQLMHAYAYLPHKDADDRTSPISLRQIDNAHFLSAILQLNNERPSISPIEDSKRRFLVAAMLHVGVLNIKNPELVDLLTKNVELAQKQDALDSALLECTGKTGHLVAECLLGWGADPDTFDIDDGVPVLKQAILFGEQALVQTLVSHGADPEFETGSSGSASQLVMQPEYSQYAPFLKPRP